MTPEQIDKELKRLWKAICCNSGSSTFEALTDGPGDFIGNELEFIRVNAAGTALEYVAPSHYIILYSSTPSIDYINGASQEITLTGDATFTFDNIPSGAFISVKIIMDGVGGHTVGFPVGVLTSGTIDNSASAVNAATIWRTGSEYLISIGNYV